MGRYAYILHNAIFDHSEGEVVINPSNNFTSRMVAKHNIYAYRWSFSDCGEIVFNDKHRQISGEVEDHVKALLETAQEYGARISGTLSYDDDQTGGSYHGLIYICSNYTALHHRFDTDFSEETPDELVNRHVVTRITLN